MRSRRFYPRTPRPPALPLPGPWRAIEDQRRGGGFRIETTLTQTLFSKPLCQCSTDGLCWSNPLPQGNQLNKIWSNGSESWAVGVGGIILKNSGQGWITLPSPTSRRQSTR